jgi:Mrp family chromosome partitioning ATPase/capsular polysaccharide biosynthesis protein
VRPNEVRIHTEANPITAILQYPFVVLVFAVVFGLVGAAFAMNQPAAFSARAGIVVEDARASTLFNSRSSDAERYVADQVAILESRVVADRASQLAAAMDPALDISVDNFLSNTTISSSQESNFITISFIASAARTAQGGADAIGLAYQQAIQEALAEDAETAVAELDQAIGAAVQEIEALQSEIEALRTDNDERVELDDQLAEIIAGLVDLRRESATLQELGLEVPTDAVGTEGAPTEAELLRAAATEISARIQQLTEELRGRLLVSDVEAQVPATAFLLRQQEDAVARLSELTLRRSQIEVDARLAGNGVAFLAPAGPGKSRGVPTSTTVVLMAAIGALLGAGAAYWLSQRRGYVENRLIPDSILEAPLLAEVPRLSTGGDPDSTDAALLPILNEPASAQAEAFRVLVGVLTQRLETARAQGDNNRGMTIAVCSSMVGEGKTVVAANTALAASRAGLSVVLVDADFGAQDASRLLSDAPRRGSSVGLTEVVRDGTRLNDAISTIDAGADSFVGLLGRGQGAMAAPDLFGSQIANRVFAQLADMYDLVIIDLPPLLQVAYATAVVQKADQALVVVRHRSPVANLHDLRYRLDVIGVKALGYVYTDAPLRQSVVPQPGPSGDVLGHGGRG